MTFTKFLIVHSQQEEQKLVRLPTMNIITDRECSKTPSDTIGKYRKKYKRRTPGCNTPAECVFELICKIQRQSSYFKYVVLKRPYSMAKFQGSASIIIKQRISKWNSAQTTM